MSRYGPGAELALQAAREMIREVTGYPNELVRIGRQRGDVRPKRPHFTLTISGVEQLGSHDEMAFNNTTGVNLSGGRRGVVQVIGHGAACARLEDIRTASARPSIQDLNLSNGIAIESTGPINDISLEIQGVYEDRATMDLVVVWQQTKLIAETVIEADNYEIGVTLKGDPEDITTTIADDLP